MGVLRFFLALAVVLTHVGSFQGLVLGSGRLAVQAFFMISGFYMALVWAEKYSKLPNSIRTFYASRALRIYPLYFFVLGVSWIILRQDMYLSVNTAFHPFAAADELGWWATMWLYLTQFTLIGMETPLFFDFGLNKYMMMPVAWSLGLELTFYLLVPFLLRRTSILIGVLVLSLTLRAIAYSSDMGVNSEYYDLLWSYRFFPFEIALFLLGSLSYILYSRLPNKFIALISKPEIYLLALFGTIGGLCYYPVLALGELGFWVYYSIIFIGMPVLFHHTRSLKPDSYIGELSYPMYIVHIPIFMIVTYLTDRESTILVVLPLTIAVSMILNIMQRHVDKYRHMFVECKT